jgi:hypothetical protein
MNMIERITEKIGIPLNTASVMMSDWTFTEYPHFEVMVKDSEVHMLAKSTFLPRSGFADVFGPILDKHGIVTTKCLVTDTASVRFIERIGFTRTHEDSMFIYFQIEKIPFERKPKCHS